MAKAKKADSAKTTRKIRPALTPEARENQMIALAVDRYKQTETELEKLKQEESDDAETDNARA